MFRKPRRHHELEARLRAERPTPGDELVRSISRRVGTRPTGVPRIALAGALSSVMLVALASVGGISYAANAVVGAAEVVKKAVSPQSGEEAIAIKGISAGRDQYRPGYGWGDDKHNHQGPPGLNRKGGAAAPPLRARPAGSLARTVSTAITLSEQALLFISVIDSRGRPLMITQSSRRGGSVVGGNRVTGMQTKFIRYQVLVPREIPLRLRLPSSLLRAGETYRIRVVAFDPDLNKSTLIVPFRG
ncbi:MAG TPA: hypothetical protein VM204_04745 [Gaiellaceae bacterium]|nr:hypothetical protein [Gaiellaceae bacterium]